MIQWLLIKSVKASWTEDASWPENVKNGQICPSVVQWRFVIQKKCFVLWIWTPQNAAMLVHSLFTNEEQRKVVLGCIACSLCSSECSHDGSLTLYQWRAEKDGFGIYIWCSLCSSERNHVGSLNLYQWRAEKGGFVMYLWCIWYSCHTCWPCSWHHWHKLLGTKWPHSWSCFHSLWT